MDNPSVLHKGTIVFFSMDAPGHIHPILSIMKELKRRHYRAVLLTTRPLKGAERIKRLGIELSHCKDHVSSGPHTEGSAAGALTSEDVLRKIMKPLIENFRREIAVAYEGCYTLDGVVGKHLNDMIENHDLIEQKLKSLKPDIIVYDHVIGIPCVVSVPKRWVRVYSGFPSAIYSALNDNYSAGFGLKPRECTKKWKELELRVKSPIRQKIREFWQAKGATDWPLELDLTPTSPYLNFYLGPQELGLDLEAHLGPLPDTWFRLEHTIDCDVSKLDEREFVIPDKLSNCQGKLIYFSLGTLVTCDTELINRLLYIFSKSPNSFIVSMGQMHEHIRLYDNMWGESYIDQRAVLKRADLFITHGGHNSIIEAFYYGVPGLIVLPVFADQFDSAQRVQDCGFGTRLNPFHCNEDEMLKAIDRTLADSKLKERMHKVSLRLRSIKYHALAADKLEQLIIDEPSLSNA